MPADDQADKERLDGQACRALHQSGEAVAFWCTLLSGLSLVAALIGLAVLLGGGAADMAAGVALLVGGSFQFLVLRAVGGWFRAASYVARRTFEAVRGRPPEA